MGGSKKLRNGIGQERNGVAQKFKHLSVFCGEVKHSVRKWRQKFELVWVKGHPEKQGASIQSSAVAEWLNDAVDKAADAEYGLVGEDGASEFLQHEGRWLLEWQGTRPCPSLGGCEEPTS